MLCVLIHAQTDSDEGAAPSVYLQVDSQFGSEPGATMEIELAPVISDESDAMDDPCHELFRALCKLVSNHS